MTGFNNNNKFVPVAPKTYTVIELRDQQVKKSPLSVAARNKVVNYSGSNYLSENQGGYGSCSECVERACDGLDKKFRLDITLHRDDDGFLGTGIFKGPARTSTYVCNTREAAQVADDVLFSRGQWNEVKCSFETRKKLSDKIHEYIRRHQNGKEFDIKISDRSIL